MPRKESAKPRLSPGGAARRGGVGEKPARADNTSPQLFAGLPEEPKLLAPTWMVATAILKDSAPSFWDHQHKDVSLDDCALPGILTLLGPYRWLFEYGSSAELAGKITTFTAAESIVEGEKEGKEDKEAQRLLFGETPSFLFPSPERIPSTREVILADSVIRNADKNDPPLSDTQLACLRKTAASPPPLLLLLNGLRSIRKKMESCKSVSVLAESYLKKNGWRFDPTAKQLVAIGKHKGRNLLTSCICALSIEFGRDAKGRTKIKQYLSPIFSIELDAGRRGKIARALENFHRGV